MANENNLKPIRSVDEAREKGKNGGKKSGEVRRERKAFKDILLAQLSVIVDKEGNTASDTLNESVLALALTSKNERAKLKAYEIIRDTIGEMPTQRIEADVKSTDAIIQVASLLDTLKKGGVGNE